MTVSAETHRPIRLRGPVLSEMCIMGAFVIIGHIVHHYVGFLAPPPPRFPLHPSDLAASVPHESVLHWGELSLFILFVLYAVILRIAHRSPWFHRNMLGIVLGTAVIGVALGFWYAQQWSSCTAEVRGERFTVGWAFSDPEDTKKYGDAYTKAIEQNPGAFDKLWTESSLTANWLWLGANYLLCLLFLAFALIVCGDLLYDLFWPSSPEAMGHPAAAPATADDRAIG